MARHRWCWAFPLPVQGKTDSGMTPRTTLRRGSAGEPYAPWSNHAVFAFHPKGNAAHYTFTALLMRSPMITQGRNACAHTCT